MKVNSTHLTKTIAFLIFCLFSISLSFAQTFQPSSGCSSSDLSLVGAQLSGGDLCNSCTSQTLITRTLTLTINNTTGSVRAAFSFWGTIKIYSGIDGSLKSSSPITGCAGPLAPKSITSLDFADVKYNCGDIVKITDLWGAWTTPSGSCPVDPSGVTSKCGVFPDQTVNGGVNGEFILTQSVCGSATGKIDLNPTGGTAPYTYSWSASDGGVIPSGQQNNEDLGFVSGTGLVPGTYTVIITDKNGCSITKSRIITPTTPPIPVFGSPSGTTVSCGAATTSSLLYTNNPSGSLNPSCVISGSVTSTLSAQTPPGAGGGTIIESWTYTDAYGRTITQSRPITISPAILPVMTTPGTITVSCGSVPAPSKISFTNGLTDDCLISGDSNLSTFSAMPNACGGTVTETWTASDAYGRVLAPVTRTINVNPAALPTMTALAPITVACGALPTPSTIPFSNGLSGNCLISGTSNPSTFSATPNSCGGNVTETWTATDSCGRTLASVSRIITVSPATLPTMTAPSNITVACGAIPAPSTISFSNGLTGGCAINGTSNPSTFSATPNACGGTVTETWTATDPCGRILTSVSRTITVSPADLPVMTAPSDITVSCGSIPAPSTISFSNGLTGGCAISGTSHPSTFTATPNACGGTVTETWTATDSCGRALASVSRTITVSPAALPTMTAPAAITVACGALPAPSRLSFSNGLTGGCTISGTSNPSTFTTTPSACGGTVTETWTATDSCGRALASVSRIITVSPAALPTMTAPAAVTVACGAVPAPSTISFSNGLGGGCLISGTSNPSTFTATPGACGGTVTETWTATDSCGRALASVSRIITVSPATLPTMTAPAAITVACGALPAPSTLSFSNGLTGGCAISGTSNPSTFSATPNACGGTVTETWKATDSCGRALASVSRTITISPADLASMTAPSDITVACGSIPAPSRISFSNGLTGGCAINGTSNPSTFSATPNACGGTVTETWTATDSCGRALASVSRVITVTPAALPAMTAPADITVTCGAVPAPSTIAFGNGLSGGCRINGTSNPSTFTTITAGYCNGEVIETWTATDNCGRALASVSRTITVNDTTAPIWSTSNNSLNRTFECSDTAGLSLAQSLAPTATDNCSTVTYTKITGAFVAGSCSNSGTYTNTWIAQDFCNNSSKTFTQVISIQDTTAPTFAAPANVTVNTDMNCTTNINPSNTGTVTNVSDNCDANPTVSYVDADCFGSSNETKISAGGDYFYFDVAGFDNLTAKDIKKVALAFDTNQGKGNVEFTLVSPNGTAIQLVGPYCNGGNCETSNSNNPETYLPVFYPNSSGFTQWNNNNFIQYGISQNLTPNGSLTSSYSINGVTSHVSSFDNLTGPMNGTWFIYGRKGGSNSLGTIHFQSVCLTPLDKCTSNKLITRTWTVTDACGNPSSKTQIIKIQDATAPTWDTAANSLDRTIECNDPAGLTAAQALKPTATDNCSADVTYVRTSGTFVVGSCSSNGTYTNTWKATDSCGNVSADFIQTITVQDTTIPTFTVPSDTEIFTSASCTYDASVTVTGDVTDEADNCSAGLQATFVDTVANGPCQGAKTITRTWSLVDACGNKAADQIQTIKVTDNIKPIITKDASNIVIECDGNGNQNAIADWLASNGGATATDNCSSVIWTNDFNAISNDCSSAVTVTFTATDACGNASSTTATFSVQDTTKPVAPEAPVAVTVSCASEIPATISLTATDNCNKTINVVGVDTTNPGTCANKYTITRTWNFIDACNNSTSISQLITVDDQIKPTITGTPENVTVSCAADVPAASITAVTATDNCAGDVTVSVNDATVQGTCANKYIVTRTWTATDVCGNSTTASQTITVDDQIKPTITGTPENVTVSCAADMPVASIAAVTATDNCSGEVTVTVNDSTVQGTCANKYTVTRTWTATDVCGNSTTASQTITVDDQIKPVITKEASNITIECDGNGNQNAIMNWLATNGGAAAIDNCSDVTWTNDFNTIGNDCSSAVTVTFTATDACGNASSTTATFAVQDITKPVAPEAPAAVTVSCASEVPATISLSATDNCNGTITVVGVDTINPGTCTNKYTVTRTWNFVDACSNSTSISQLITVDDQINPTITGTPENVTVSCADDVPMASIAAVTATDNCAGNVTVTVNDVAVQGNCPNKFIVTRTWTATDVCGNSTTASQIITVDDKIKPTITGTPENITVSCGAEVPAPSIAAVTATDNCAGDVTVTVDDATVQGNCPNSYTVTRTWTATDVCGNSTTAIQTITIEDKTAPVAPEAPASITVDCAGDVPQMISLTATDNCNEQITVEGVDVVTEGSCANSFTITRTWTFTDACENTSSVSQTIAVIDTVAPAFNEATPADASVSCGSIPSAVTLTANDNCGTATVTMTETQTPIQGGCSSNYKITRTWTATDACGNDNSVTQTITVSDTTGPILVTPLTKDIDVNCDNIPDAPVFHASDFADSCSAVASPLFTQTKSEISNDAYTITRTWTVMDACGNMSQYTQNIHVSLVPKLIKEIAAESCTEAEFDTVNLMDLLPKGTPTTGTLTDVDNVGKLTGTVFNAWQIPVGVYTFSYTFMDESGMCLNKYDIKMTVKKDCVVLPCESIVIHNAFTPNGDGTNEFFKVDHIDDVDCYPSNRVEIYNRWGILVYEADNYDNNTRKFEGISWGRTTVEKNAELPTGTYFYIIQWKTTDGHTINKDGYLYLTR